MPLQNRADPLGLLHAVPQRGTLMGNRGGCFHRDDQTLKARQWSSQRWITCRLAFKNRRRPLMRPGHYTEIFFLDEATALAGGHRPCFECRREEAVAFREALIRAGRFVRGAPIGEADQRAAGEIQDVLAGRAKRVMVTPATLPDGAMYGAEGAAWLVYRRCAHAWSFSGYGPGMPLHQAGMRLTPEISCAALDSGYQAALHTSIGSA
ncbi:conserved hypothetical protein [Hyphomonas neptunium ATCC 15444]|uniref:Uncharacterized protein n=2 Tax=Hyphomonas TaxID=85 RepID=Q0BXQ1_HYPNA|nr:MULTISPECIES: hypothetical protein [Hyphomonas]ABI77296.1 conserved hypothetical protein [Hyphomonas neptunium ATCC 15444]KCZ93568.1 hypothetical protein HHI_09237 [Hyphomonas hirschiana VP5]